METTIEHAEANPGDVEARSVALEAQPGGMDTRYTTEKTHPEVIAVFP